MASKSNYHAGPKRDECYFCGSGPPLREHHIIPQRFDGPDTPENVVELCDLCHKRIERLYDKSFFEWFGINDEKGERTYHRPCDGNICDNRRKVKILARLDDCQIYNVRNGWGVDEKTGGSHSQYYYTCRPCAAKLAKEMHHHMWYTYERDKEKLHSEARKRYESDEWTFDPLVDGTGKWLKGSIIWDKQPPWPVKPRFSTPEGVHEELILERADD